MATVSAKILKHHLKAEGSNNVKIRIFNKKEKRYINTEHYVSNKKLSKTLTIKDPFINQMVNHKIYDYRMAIAGLGLKLDFFSAESRRNYLAEKNKEINFIEFCDCHIIQLRKDRREGTASNHTTVRNSLVDFFKRDNVLINEITSAMLRLFENFFAAKDVLSEPTSLKRSNDP